MPSEAPAIATIYRHPEDTEPTGKGVYIKRSNRVSLPSEDATKRELWRWIENVLPIVEAHNFEYDEAAKIQMKYRITHKEALMLELLHRRKGVCVTKDQFMNQLYSTSPEIPEIKIVDVFICKLRRKLKHRGSKLKITTVWGRGYILEGTLEEDTFNGNNSKNRGNAPAD